jgi:hypothetical protein
MQALKEEKNMKGLEPIKALRKFDDILNNSPTMYSTDQRVQHKRIDK